MPHSCSKDFYICIYVAIYKLMQILLFFYFPHLFIFLTFINNNEKVQALKI